MANFVLNFSGESTDDFTEAVNNFKSSIFISGLDANSQLTISFSESTFNYTASSEGTYIFYPEQYGIYTIAGVKSNSTVSDTINVNSTKKYTLSF